MRYAWLGFLLALAAPLPALAQGCGPQNPNCVVPTRPIGDSTNAAADTAFVTRAVGGGGSVNITQGTGIALTPNPLLGSGSVAIANTAVAPSSYGDGTHVASFTVNQQGQLTAAANVAITNQGTLTSITQGNGIVLSPSPITATGLVSADVAANANVWAGTANKLIDGHVAQTSIVPVALTISTATFTPDFSAAINLEITLVHASCPCTIANPTNVYAGLSGYLTIIQSATGSDTIGTWGGNWKFAGGAKPTLSTAANAVDTVGFYCRTTTFCEVSLSGIGYQ